MDCEYWISDRQGHVRKLASVRVDEGTAAGRSAYALVVNLTHVSKPSGTRGCPASPARSDSASEAPEVSAAPLPLKERGAASASCARLKELPKRGWPT